MTIDVGTVSCDFERGLIIAVEGQFPEANNIGCLFHFKQAVRRKMQILHIPAETITGMMQRGFVDSLTVIPRDRIDPTGLTTALRERGTEYSPAKRVDFWAYFHKTWLETYKPHLWNVHGIQQMIVNRTNNPLERFNRNLNGAFLISHPNILTFVRVIGDHASHYVTLLEDIAHN
ncbi:Hypothetical protein PHPALM_542 [Phytophthora palmivora]|uniref:MULE transposase domain-containing protein n=1 Tax=Phytophthora palmivora TaxID=4796 RepID=A0A2P4YUK7_9STRA|nr:Hypothetical protein PHPALM_542 [Phytophthora palmivora]